MSDVTQLPPCRLCGAAPSTNTKISGHVICPSSRGRCGLGGVLLSEDEWRRLHGPQPEMTDSRRAFTREEMIEEAKAYMRETWGPCLESEDRDRWHERLGMLVDFIHGRFPANAPHQARRDSGVALDAVVGGSGTEVNHV